MATSSCVTSLDFRLPNICCSRLNYREPKLLNFNFNPNSKPKTKTNLGLSINSKFPCSAVSDEYSVVRKKSHQVLDFDFRDLFERTIDVISYFCFGHSRRQILTIMVKLRNDDDDDDDDGMLKELIRKATEDVNPLNTTSIVLNEVVPCLLNSADHWVSSRLIVAETFKESFEKVLKACKEAPALVPLEEHALDAPYVQVVVEVYIIDVIDKVENIRTFEDLKALLQELESMKSMMYASALHLPVFLREEDTETYSHITY